MRNTSKVVIGIVAALVIFLTIVGAIFYLSVPAESNNTKNPIATLAPTSTASNVTIKFSLWEENGTAMPVESTSLVNSGSGYSIVTTPLEFTYSSATEESYTFIISNDGNAPINVNATILAQNTPSDSNVSMSTFYVKPDLIPATKGYVTVGVGQSTTVLFDSTLQPGIAGETVAGFDGSLYSFKLKLLLTQAS